MSFRTFVICTFSVLMMISIYGFLISIDSGNAKAQNAPALYGHDAYEWDEFVVFEVYYQDADNDDSAGVYLLLGTDADDEWIEMYNWKDGTPSTGMLYEYYMDNTLVDAYTEFYFYAEDTDGDFTQLDDGGYYFMLGNFIGFPSSIPVLSAADANVAGDNVLFEVAYQDADGEEGMVTLVIDDTQLNVMSTQDSDPVTGQGYTVSILKSSLTVDTQFFFMADNSVDEVVYLPPGTEYFRLGDYVTAAELEDSGNGGTTDTDGKGSDSALFSAWTNPEVIVGLVALVGMAGAGGYGIYRSRKKRNRFSELLTAVDSVYRSYKMHPHQCEVELEKIRAVISEELKRNVIDENNYSILKERIDELMSEIRSESLLTEVRDLPKDIELRIKDMLIDGKITRAEYDKLLPIIKGSEMTTGDKEKMEKTLESWVEKDKKGGK